jgi:hypothetical protein
MSTPAVSPEAPKKELNWKRLFIKAVGFGAGLALMLAVLAGVGLWYVNRPKPPKPWNQQAIKAEFDYPDTEGEANSIVVFYTLINDTDTDYEIRDGDSIRMAAKLGQQKSLSVENNNDYLKPDTSVFIPAHQRARFAIHLKFPYPEKLQPGATNDQGHDFRTYVAKYIVKEMGNLDGFVIFDEQHRYQIMLPSGWKDRAKEALKIPSSNK